MDKQAFFYPRSRYYGEDKPVNLEFNSELQAFVTRVSYLANLVTNGKIPPINAYQQIESLWEQLQQSKHKLDTHD